MTANQNERPFGFFKGLPYSGSQNRGVDFQEYSTYTNKLDRDKAIKHIEGLDIGYSSFHTHDLFTGADLGNAGIIIDGPFVFPVDFLYYYKKGMIGLPVEYERYLVETIGL